MILEQTEQTQILDLMSNYKHLHDEIARVEVSIRELESEMKRLYSDKDRVINGIENNRDNEATIIKALVDKYGEGKLDVTTMTWYPNEIKQEE